MKYPSLSSGLVTLLLAQLFSTAVQGGDWPQFHGPQRDAISTETGLLTEWPTDGPPLVWKAQELGGGYSTPSIAAGRIFGMSYKGDEEVVWALDAKTGKLLWSFTVGVADRNIGSPGQGPEGSRSTPTVDGELLYTIGAGGTLVCLETATGKERWKKNFRQDFGGAKPNWGFAESPLVDGNNLICTPGGSEGTILALNKLTGATVWRSKDFKDSAAYSSIIAAKIDGVRQYIQYTDKTVVGVAPEDGRVLWRAARNARITIPSPIYYSNHVYIASGYGVGCHLFKITSEEGKFKAEQVYANNDMVNHHGGVIRIGEHLFGFSDRGGWTCQEFMTGKVVWKDPGVGKGSITFADGHFYLRSEGRKGTLALIEATPAGYKEKGRFDQPNRASQQSWAHPVISNGKLYIRDQDVLLCYDVTKKKDI
jgi:outer membrane protein assembly factor BamB